MKTWEALRLLDEGKKVRRKYLSKDLYICLSVNGNLIRENGSKYELGSIMTEDWEEYIEPVKKYRVMTLAEICAKYPDAYLSNGNLKFDRDSRWIGSEHLPYLGMITEDLDWFDELLIEWK